MRADVKINDLWMFAMGWLREEIDFPMPQSQTNTVVVPGRNAPIRFTEALGRVSYQPRSFSITLSMLGSREKFNQMKDLLANLYAGQLCQVILSEELDLYALGTLELEPAYDPLTGKGQMVLSCSDGDSYRYHTEETVVTITGGGTAILNNDYMPVVPTVVTTAETALSWSIGEDVFPQIRQRRDVDIPGTGTAGRAKFGQHYGRRHDHLPVPGGTPMSLFRVFVDGQLFYHPHLSQLSITEAKVQEDAENIDSLTLSAPFNHPYLFAIRPMASTIVCKKDELTVFEGRALDDGTDFYNTHTWTCESCLAYLKDTMQPPFSYQGPLRGLLEQFLSVHNAAVEEKKQFTLGTVTVTDNNDYISYSNSDYSVTMDAMQDKLIKTHGGYLQVRYTDMGKFLDYLEDFPDRSLQTVEFGKNLTDVKITRDHTERVTALIPLGAKITETEEDGNETETDTRLDITAVNDGKNYVYDEEAVEEIGWIWTTEIWEDVTLAGNLLRKANARLSELVKGVTSMELTIVDESDTGADIGDIRARMYVRCISKPHGIDGTYLCLSRTRDYLNPSGNTITIGAAGVRLTSESAKQDQNITSIEDELLGQTSKIEVITGKVDQINAQKMYRTELVVDGVNIFRDKGQKSILRCRVYSWDKEITDTLPASSFVWHRNSGREDLDADWDSSHTGMKSITVTTEDVTDNASFYCEITI